jgi:hypothetical protein
MPEEVIMADGDGINVRPDGTQLLCRRQHFRPGVLAVPVRDQHHHQTGPLTSPPRHFLNGQIDALDCGGAAARVLNAPQCFQDGGLFLDLAQPKLEAGRTMEGNWGVLAFILSIIHNIFYHKNDAKNIEILPQIHGISQVSKIVFEIIV